MDRYTGQFATNMEGITPTQQKSLETWAAQRDALLREIGQYQVECEALRKEKIESGLALNDLHVQIAETRGRLAEIDAMEEVRRNSLSIDVAELEARKSRLESECKAKEDELKIFDERKREKIASIDLLILTHAKMADQAKVVDEVVGQVIATSQKHTGEIAETMANIRTLALEVIEKGNENVKQTGIVLEKLPQYIFELQKPIPIRRAYAVPHKGQIDPEPKK